MRRECPHMRQVGAGGPSELELDDTTGSYYSRLDQWR
jgi:hypothetical protein